MSWIKEQLDKLDATDRSYYLVTTITLTIPLPVLFMLQITPWFGLMYLLAPLILLHKDIWIYLSHIKINIIATSILAGLVIATTYLSSNEGFKALIAAIYIIGGVILAHLAYNKLLKYMESIGVE